jgi:hypothetical protein
MKMSDVTVEKNQQFADQKLEIRSLHHVIGCVFERCQIRFCKPNSQWVADNVFKDCEIRVLGKYNNSWQNCQFVNCRFYGTYWNTSLGLSGTQYALQDRFVHCDFSASKMHFIRMFNCVVADTAFPKWPHIAVFDNELAMGYLSTSTDPMVKLLCRTWPSNTIGMVARIWNLKVLFPTAQKEYSDLIRISQRSDRPIQDWPILDLEWTRGVFENCPGVMI